MKIEANKAVYPLPRPVGQILSVTLDEGVQTMSGYLYALRCVSLGDILSRRADEVAGRPVWFAITEPSLASERQHILLWPTPNKDAELRIEFFGPREVM